MTAGLPVTDRIPSARQIMFTLCAAVIVVLAGCGGGGDEQAASVNPPSSNPPSNTPPTSTPNQAPTIGGSPTAQVLVGVSYSFQPSAGDAENNSLTFSITGKPSWATFSTSTGLLTGTPGAGDVGQSANIVISVTDGTTQTSLAAFKVTVVAVASGSATLSWNAPTQNTDGSALMDLAGYKIAWGTSQTNLSNSATVGVGIQTYMIPSLTPATWYFAVTAQNASGSQSSPATASKVVL